MAKKSAICGEAGKTYLINPNLLFGQDAEDNLSVPLEDLNIYVELTTSKKSRSIIDVTETGIDFDSSSAGKRIVSFISGSDYGGKDKDGNQKTSLTTSYTELTTVFNGKSTTASGAFNQNADTEKFGITSIDVNFNSSYAPLIKIEFVDIRGASLFNTDTGNGPQSEYSGFFDLPYPIFELKIKGYYGKPVKYCLHLTKWNARFNAQTGNFEITADFIGYTYAMLTDMLLGYLRAITKTPRGIAKFNAAKAEMNNPAELITINELLTKIVDVNEAVTKLQSEDEDINELAKNKDLKTGIKGIENLMNKSIEQLTVPDDSNLKGYAIFNAGDGLFGVRADSPTSEETKNNIADLQNFKDAIKAQIGKVNETLVGESQLNPDDFTNVKTYNSWVYNDIMTGDSKSTQAVEFNSKQLAFRTSDWELNDDQKFEDFRQRTETIRGADKNKLMTIYDFKSVVDNIKELQARLDKDEELIKESVGLKLQGTFTDVLGFEPTIRNIFRIFTIHAEIFMDCLKDVSTEAEKDEGKLRKAELEKLKEEFDIHKDDTDDNGLPPKIYPWPLYRKASVSKSKNQTYEEAWLGADIAIPQNVPEIVFVEELLEGLLAVAREDIDRQARIDNPNTIVDSWFPVNPLDTPLFGVIQNPYKTATIGNSNNILDPLKLMGMRAFAFLGASNRVPRTEEVTVMGTLEANTCYEGIQNDVVRNAFLDVSKTDAELTEDIINIFLSGSNGERKIAFKQKPEVSRPIMYSEDYFGEVKWYHYKYISDNVDGGKGQKFIPFNGNFDGEEFYLSDGKTPTPTSTLKSKSYLKTPDGALFLGTKQEDNSVQPGAIMLKIFTEDEYGDDTKGLRPDYVNQVDSIKKMINDLKEIAGDTPLLDSGQLYTNEITGAGAEKDMAGWNILGDETSKYAFTTVKYVNITPNENSKSKIAGVGETGEGDNTYTFPHDNVPGAPVISMFYVDMLSEYGATSLSEPLNIKPEFSDDRIFSNTYGDFYPIRVAGARKWSKSKQAKENPKLGKNRELFNQEGVYIPHVDFMSINQQYSNTYTHWSLFGSQLYFEQRQSSSPISARAYLFLHTLPWNQLFTDNSESDGQLAAIFENNEGHTIANLFNRKAAFIHAPYLWCAFIGAILWRYNTDDIIYETGDDPLTGGKVPTFEGGSGEIDPIIWGKKVNPQNAQSNFKPVYVPEYENANSWSNNTLVQTPWENLPTRSQFATSYRADSPMSFETDGQFKFISNTLTSLPTQIKKEFRRIFFDFVKSAEWKSIREEFEIHDKSWDLPDANTTTTYNVNGYADGSFDDGTTSWENRWKDTALIINTDSQTIGDSLYWQPYVAATSTGSGSYAPQTTTPASGGITGLKVDKAKAFRNFENLEYLMPIRTRATLKGESGSDGVKSAPFLGLPQYEQSKEYNYDLGHKDGTANQTMVSLFKKGVWIANCSYKPWAASKFTLQGGDVYFADSQQNSTLDKFTTERDTLFNYIQAFVAEWKRLNKLDPEKTEEDNLKQQIFNTMDNDTIRLNIYRHCKSLYDKWIAGSQGDIMTTCGTGKKLVDQANITRSRKRGSKHRLIDSFRFTNRAFNDLGDEYLLNPKIITDIVLGNPNQSFYDLISRTLADNNFNFIALPAFIDYNSKTEMEALFRPEIYNNDDIDASVSGPTFVCVYVGQGSNKLDLGKGSAFPNDGFDFRCDENGNLDMAEEGLPKDFSKPKLSHEHNVVAFAVNYGQQNQNIFTDVKLDQQEFSETDESLQITDAIANQGAQSSRTQAGQNLWNVYQVRSYSTQVTAMGNAMIQPMMYFQLNNIPMFHGAYMIINTTHKITPNFMTTTFKGVRTRYVDTPQIDSETLYMSMLGTLSDVDGLAAIDTGAYNSTTGLESDVLPTDPTQVNDLGFASVYPEGIGFKVVSGVGPRNAQKGASKFHPGLDMAPKDNGNGIYLAPNGDTSVVWSKGFDYSTVDKDSKGRPKVNVPVLAGADSTIFGLRVSPSVGIILDVLVDKTDGTGAGFVMRYMHILDVSDKIVEAAAKKSGKFTLDDWKNNNISGDLRVKIDVKVKQGEVIGLTGGQRRLRAFGSTDTAGPYSSGPHLHLELLEFTSENLDKDKIKSCVSCRKSDYADKGLTANLKDYKAFLADGSTGKGMTFATKQRTQDDGGDDDAT